MADDSRKFEIKIVTTSDPQGAQQAAQGLHDIGNATAKTAESAEELNKKTAETRRLFGELDRISPGLGESLKALFDPEAIGMIASIVVLQQLFERARDLKQQYEEVRKEIYGMGIALRDAQEDAESFFNKVIAGQEKAKDATDKINEAYEHRKTILDALAQGESKILDALEKQELAQANGDKDKEAEIKSRYERAGVEVQSRTAQQQIDLIQQQLAAATGSRPGLQSAQSALNADIRYLQEHAGAPPGFQPNKDLENKLRQNADDTAAELQRILTGKRTAEDVLIGRSPQEAAERASNAKSALDEYETNRRAFEEHTQAVDREKAELDRTTAALEKNQAQIDQLTSDLADARAKLAAQFASDELQKAIGLEARAQAGQPLNPSESMFVRSVASMVAGQDMSQRDAERMMQLAAEKTSVLQNYLGRLLNLFERMPNPAYLESRLSALERNFSNLPAMRGSSTGQ